MTKYGNWGLERADRVRVRSPSSMQEPISFSDGGSARGGAVTKHTQPESAFDSQLCTLLRSRRTRSPTGHCSPVVGDELLKRRILDDMGFSPTGTA